MNDMYAVNLKTLTLEVRNLYEAINKRMEPILATERALQELKLGAEFSLELPGAKNGDTEIGRAHV